MWPLWPLAHIQGRWSGAEFARYASLRLRSQIQSDTASPRETGEPLRRSTKRHAAAFVRNVIRCPSGNVTIDAPASSVTANSVMPGLVGRFSLIGGLVLRLANSCRFLRAFFLRTSPCHANACGTNVY